MEFKIGDQVRVKENCSQCEPGNIYVLTNSDDDGTLYACNEDLKKKLASGCSCRGNWELVKNGKQVKEKPMQFVVIWEEDSDPYEFFETKIKAMKKIKELLENKEVREDSIQLVEIKKHWKIEKTVNARLNKL